MANVGAFSLADYQPYTGGTAEPGKSGFWGTVGSIFGGLLGSFSSSGGTATAPIGGSGAAQFDLLSILSPSTAGALNKYNADGSVKTDISGSMKLFGVAAIVGVVLYFLTQRKKR